MYIDSIEEFGLNTSEIINNLNTLNNIETIDKDIEKLDIKSYVKDFLKFTFSVIKRGKIHEVASVFTFGREDLIPDMFIPLIEGINSENNDLDGKIYYSNGVVNNIYAKFIEKQESKSNKLDNNTVDAFRGLAQPQDPSNRGTWVQGCGRPSRSSRSSEGYHRSRASRK